VDRVLHDGDTVSLGGTVLTAHKTPGHTKGCTTWTMQVKDGGKSLNVVFVGSPKGNPGYVLVGNKKYPAIAQDYEKTFQVLKALPADVFLGAHGDYYGMPAKYEKLKAGGPNPFVDPDGYKAYVAENAKAFRKYGGRFLVRGGRYEAPEGKPRSRTVVIEFPTHSAALECYRSPEYAKAITLRQGKSLMDLSIVEGYDGPQPGDA